MLMTRGTIWTEVFIYNGDHSFDVAKGLQVCGCKPLDSQVPFKVCTCLCALKHMKLCVYSVCMCHHYSGVHAK